MRHYFIDAYIECAAWAENDDSDAWGNASFAPKTRERLERDAGAFFDANESDIRAYCEGVAQAGHDLWLTRRGHGCGFWEHNDSVSVRLDNAAKVMGDCELYVGDDGKIWSI